MKSLALVVALLTGCTHYYNHPSKSDADFESDLYECEKDAAPVRDPDRRRQMMDRCLRVKGWQYEKSGMF